ncbi:MAG: hypothetical protein LBC61_00365 [Candidatus Peribacteria bacterium]|nr:hypothetical protein [Candidatus Peribacteria bacterium]
MTLCQNGFNYFIIYLNMKKIFLILLSLVLITSCNSSLPTEDEEKIKIETSIIPLASITNYIGSEFVEVKSIVPA